MDKNKVFEFNLNSDQFDYLVRNSDLKQVDKYGTSPLMFALDKNVSLKMKTWKYLIENSAVFIIENPNLLFELKKIQSKLLNDEILSKIDIQEKKNKLNKI